VGWGFGLFTAPLSELIERIFRGPRIKLEFDGEREDFRIRTPIAPDPELPNHPPKEAYFVRVRVVNFRGWRRWSIRSATDCKGYLIKLERQNRETGKFEPSGYCDSLPLKWSYLDDNDASRGIVIPDQVAQYVNVVATYSNRPDFVPETVLAPYRYWRLFDPAALMPPGKETEYAILLTIQVCAEETHPQQIALVLEWKGNWENFRVYRAN
jgi:hypothetical protein